mgnify:CR=1 FL=1
MEKEGKGKKDVRKDILAIDSKRVRHKTIRKKRQRGERKQGRLMKTKKKPWQDDLYQKYMAVF